MPPQRAVEKRSQATWGSRAQTATARMLFRLLLLGLLGVCQIWSPAAAQSPGGPQAGPQAPAECVAGTYAALENITSSGGGECGSATHIPISLDCDVPQKQLARKTMPPLVVQAAPGTSWSITSDCFHTLLINMSDSAVLPVLSVKGTPGSGSKLTLRKLRILLVGTANEAPLPKASCPGSSPCSSDVKAIVDISGVDDVDIKDLIVSPLDDSLLPYIGIRISGAVTVKLDSIFTRSCADGIQVLQSGDLDSNNLRCIGNSNMGLAYTCSDERPATGVKVRGSRSGFTQNAGAGMSITCDNIYKAGPLQVTVLNTVLFGSNIGPGLSLSGEVQALFWPGVMFSGNGAASPRLSQSISDCGGGLYAKLHGTRSSIVFTGVKFYNNNAAAGGGVCVWLSHEPPQGASSAAYKAAATVTVQSNTVFNGNAAKDGCGGAITTIADMTQAQLDVSVKDSTKSWNRNTAAAAPTWCVLQAPETTSYMAINLA